jgi:hypothetical protein
VLRGFEQVYGLNYGETFAPVPKLATVRLLFALAAAYDWDIHQMDVVTAFLHPTIDEEVYMEVPEGYDKEYPRDEWVCKLNKAIYGLKQASHTWYKDIDGFLLSLGFTRSNYDSNLYMMANSGVILLLYVDDILLFSTLNTSAGSPPPMTIADIKANLAAKYKMKDLGEAKTFLGMEIERDRQAKTIKLHQAKYIDDILAQFGMQDCNGVATPLDPNQKLRATDLEEMDIDIDIGKYQSIVGKLMYAMIATRPDLAYTVSTLGKFAANPSPTHMAAAKRCLRYLKQTSTIGITYSGFSTHEPQLT